MFKILAFDGGGIRGLLSSVLMERLSTNQFIEKTDLFAGTSTGSIIALGLASGFSPSMLINLYQNHAKEIFDDSWVRDLKDVYGLIGSKYDNQNLFKILTKCWGTNTIKSLSKKVVIPTFNLHAQNPDRWEPYIMDNFDNAIEDPTFVETAMRSSSAPTFFPSWKSFVDGGIVCNNPAMAAVAETVSDSNIKLEEIVILSIGTGINFSYISGEDLDFGEAQWVQPLIQILLDNNDSIAGIQCRKILKDRYWRVNPILNSKISLDDCSKIDELIDIGNKFDLSETINWIQKYWI